MPFKDKICGNHAKCRPKIITVHNLIINLQDEVHLLHDERGPVLESLVARSVHRYLLFVHVYICFPAETGKK